MAATAAPPVAARLRAVVEDIRTLLDIGCAAQDLRRTFTALRPALAAHFGGLLALVGPAADGGSEREPGPPLMSSLTRGGAASVSARTPALGGDLALEEAARSARSARSASRSAARAAGSADTRAHALPAKRREARGGPNAYGVWLAAHKAADARPMRPAEARAAWTRIKASPTGKTMAALKKRADSLRRRRGAVTGRAVVAWSPPLGPTVPPVTRALAATFAAGGHSAGGSTARGRADARTVAAAAATPAAPAAARVPMMGAPTPSAALALLGMGARQRRAHA